MSLASKKPEARWRYFVRGGRWHLVPLVVSDPGGALVGPVLGRASGCGAAVLFGHEAWMSNVPGTTAGIRCGSCRILARKYRTTEPRRVA